MEALQWLASLGVGGVLAGMMFLYYRQDRLSFRERWEEHTKALTELIHTYQADAKETREVLRELAHDLRRRNGS